MHFLATNLVVPKPPESFESRDAYLQYVRSIELRTLNNGNCSRGWIFLLDMGRLT